MSCRMVVWHPAGRIRERLVLQRVEPFEAAAAQDPPVGETDKVRFSEEREGVVPYVDLSAAPPQVRPPSVEDTRQARDFGDS